MRASTTFLALLLMSFGLTCSDLSARGRNNTESPSSPSQNSSPMRPGNNTGNNNPGTPSQRPSTPNVKPTVPNNQGPQRPNNNVTTPQRPNNTVTTPQRPNNPPQPNYGPGPQSPGYSVPPRPNNAPPRPNSYNPGYNYRPPMPYTPPSYSYYRPTPPPSWRPSYNSPNFSSILGITLGSLISSSVNSLLSYGYDVTGYNPNEVFLNNVNFCNVNWPNATMYYKNSFLCGSLFSASSISYDQSRYYYVYNYLTSLYGYPVTVQNLNGGGTACTWWGYNNTYLTLSFYPEYIPGAGTRYFTTLATGY